MYANGKGVKQDFKEAFKWLQKSADQGYAKAQTFTYRKMRLSRAFLVLRCCSDSLLIGR
jgi:TPR repeat protein